MQSSQRRSTQVYKYADDRFGQSFSEMGTDVRLNVTLLGLLVLCLGKCDILFAVQCADNDPSDSFMFNLCLVLR